MAIPGKRTTLYSQPAPTREEAYKEVCACVCMCACVRTYVLACVFQVRTAQLACVCLQSKFERAYITASSLVIKLVIDPL